METARGMNVTARKPMRLAWWIHALAFGLSASIGYGFLSITSPTLRDSATAAQLSRASSTPIPESAITSQPLVVFANRNASWDQLDRAVAACPDSTIVSLLSDSNALLNIPNSNRDSLSYFFFHKIGGSQPVASLLKLVAAEYIPDDLQYSLRSGIRRSGHIGWITARDRSQVGSYLREAAAQYDYTSYLNFVRAYCATGLGASPSSDYADAMAVGKSKFGAERDLAPRMMLSTALGWSFVRPRDAMDFILAQSWTDTNERAEALKYCIDIVSFFDPDLARELLQKCYSVIGGARIATFCMSLQLKDVQGIFDRLDATGRAGFIRTLANSYFSSDQSYEISQLCMALDPAKLNDSEKAAVGGALFRTLPDSAAQWFLRIPEDQRAAVLKSAYQNSPHQPGVARLYIDLHAGATDLSDDSIRDAILNLAQSNPTEARKEIAKLSPEAQAKWGKSVLHGEEGYLLHAKPEDLASQIETLPPDFREKFAVDVSSWWAQAYPENALQWAKNFPDPALREQMEAKVLADGDLPLPEKQQEILDAIERTGKPADYHSQLKSVVSQYCQTDPAKAIDCLGQVKDPALNQSLTADLAKSWCATDPAAASGWISALPGGAGRDAAVAEYVQAIPDDPDAALASVISIGDASLRVKAAASVIGTWAKVNKPYAEDLLSNSKLSDDDKVAISRAVIAPGSPPPANK